MHALFSRLTNPRPQKRRGSRSSITPEALEQRTLLTSVLWDGTWYIGGTNASDQIEVSNSDALTDEATLVATRNGKVIGTQEAEDVRQLVIWGSKGDDRIAVADDIEVPATLNGGAGDDTLIGGAGSDTINGGSGDDTLIGNEGADRLFGASGHDNLRGGLGDDSLYGGAGNDELFGDGDDDYLAGHLGDDLILGGRGDDHLLGGLGNDRLFGGANNDIAMGEVGNDEIFGGDGNDELFGGFGADFIAGEAGDDHVDGGVGRDTLLGGEGDDNVVNDLLDVITETQLQNIENLWKELDRIADESDVTPEQVRALIIAAKGVIDGIELPPAETRRFLETFEAAVEDGRITEEEGAQLAEDGKAVLEKTEVPPERVEEFVSAIEAIVVASNIDADDLRKVAEHIRAIRVEFLRNHFTEEQNASIDQFRGTLAELAAGADVTDEQTASFLAVFEKVLELDDDEFPRAEATAFGIFLVAASVDGTFDPTESFTLGVLGRNFFRAAGMSRVESAESWKTVVEFWSATNIDFADVVRVWNDFSRLYRAFSA